MKALQKLEQIVSKDRLLTTPDEIQGYHSDWSRTPAKGAAVVLPTSTEEVSAILKVCFDEGIAVVPSGGRTGLVGGACALKDELILSLCKMNKIGTLDRVARTLQVQAGVTTEEVHNFCATEGLTWPIDLAAKGSSHIGGNLATNAGGVRVIRYGMARKWCVGLTAVAMDGSVFEIQRGLEKNNCGYDLLQLLIGSEGTLAVITEAVLKLAPLSKDTKAFLFSVESTDAIRHLLSFARSGPFVMQAFEFFSRRCLETVERQLKRQCKLQDRSEFLVLLEIEPHAGADLVAWLESVLVSGNVKDGWMAQSTEESRQIWELREGITESIALTGPVKKFDISVPVNQIVDFLDQVQGRVKKYQFQLYLFGHFGDGSPHLNLVKPKELGVPEYEKQCQQFEKEIFEMLLKMGGAVSSEHGMGLLRKNWLDYSRTPFERNVFRAIKKAFDPKGLLNPGKVVPMNGGEGDRTLDP